MTHRIYIDESGDPSYRGLTNPGRRYMGLTGVVLRKAEYDPAIPLALEALKRKHFPYDSDFPVSLHRKDIMQKRQEFRVLQEAHRNRAWETDLLSFLTNCPFRCFTVVFDKSEHQRRLPGSTESAYGKCLSSLLETIAASLGNEQDNAAEVLLESRGARADSETQLPYENLRSSGTHRLSADEFQTFYPEESLFFRRKEHNVAGLQSADIIVFEQTRLALLEDGRALESPIGRFGQRLNEAIRDKGEASWRKVIQ